MQHVLAHVGHENGVLGESRWMASLTQYFSGSGYWNGELFQSEGYETCYLNETEFFKHRSGIRVWSLLLDLREDPASRGELVYHYTDQKMLDLVAGCQDRSIQLFLRLASAVTNTGFGPEVCQKAPEEWSSEEELLINCLWPCQKEWEAWTSLPMPTGSVASDFLETPMQNYVKQKFRQAEVLCSFAGETDLEQLDLDGL